MAMVNRMTKIGGKIARFGTTIYLTFVMSTLTRELPRDYSCVKESFKGQQPDSEEILKCALVMEAKSVKRDPQSNSLVHMSEVPTHHLNMSKYKTR